MFCRKCGEKILDDSVFCPKCGNRIVPEEESTTPESSDEIKTKTEEISPIEAGNEEKERQEYKSVNEGSESVSDGKKNSTRSVSIEGLAESKTAVMNKKNLILLIVVGMDLLFGALLFVFSLFSGDYKEDPTMQIAFTIAMGSIIGGSVMLWKIKEALMGRTVLSFLIYAFVLIILFFGAVYKSVTCAVILLVLALILAFKLSLSLITEAGNKRVRYGIIGAAVLLVLIVLVSIIVKNSHKETNTNITTQNQEIVNEENGEITGKVAQEINNETNQEDQDEIEKPKSTNHTGKWWPDGMYVYDAGPKGVVAAYDFQEPDLLYVIRNDGTEKKYQYKYVGDQMLVKKDEPGHDWIEAKYDYDEESETLIFTNTYNDKEYFKYAGKGRDRSSGALNESVNEEVPEFDPFEGITIEYSGISGQAEAKISGDLQGLKAVIEPKSGLKNGDTITVKIEDANIDVYVAQEHRRPNPLEKTYTVEGLESYELEEKDFTEEFVKTANASTREELEKYITASCKATTKNKFLINKVDKVKLTWATSGKLTSDPVLIRADIGKKNSGSGNMMLLLYEVPYECFIKDDNSGKHEEGKILGEGSAFVALKYTNVINENHSINLGSVDKKTIRQTKDEIFSVQNKFIDEYTFTSIDFAGDEDSSSDKEEATENNADEKLIAFAKGEEKDSNGKTIDRSETEFFEYLLLDMNSDGQNELLIRRNGWCIPIIYEVKDNKIEGVVLEDENFTGMTYVNKNKQFVADEGNEIDLFAYRIIEFEKDGSTKSIMHLIQHYYDENEAPSCYKVENPTTEEVTAENGEEISEADFEKLRKEYIQDDASLSWTKVE